MSSIAGRCSHTKRCRWPAASADKTTLADVLASTHWATHGPDTCDESIGLAEELGRWPTRSETAACGHWHMLG